MLPRFGRWHSAQPIDFEGLTAGLDVLGGGRGDEDGGGEALNESDQGITFLWRQIRALRPRFGGQGRDRLPMAGDFQAKLAGTGREHEFPQVDRLCLPAELTDVAALHPVDPTADPGWLLLGRRDQYLVRQGIDQTQPK